MTSPATPPAPKNPKNPKTASATSKTAPATPPAAATAVGDAGELESVADAASEATEIAAALAVQGTDPATGTGPAATAQDPARQFRAVDDNVLATAKLTGALTLDAYENSLHTLLAWEQRVGAVGGPGWLGELTRAHVALVTSVSEPVFAAARQALK